MEAVAEGAYPGLAELHLVAFLESEQRELLALLAELRAGGGEAGGGGTAQEGGVGEAEGQPPGGNEAAAAGSGFSSAQLDPEMRFEEWTGLPPDFDWRSLLVQQGDAGSTAPLASPPPWSG